MKQAVKLEDDCTDVIVTDVSSESSGSVATEKEKRISRLIPLSDRTANMEAMILSTMAEINIAFSAAPKVLHLIKECSRDPKALSNVNLGHCCFSAEYNKLELDADIDVEHLGGVQSQQSGQESGINGKALDHLNDIHLRDVHTDQDREILKKTHSQVKEDTDHMADMHFIPSSPSTQPMRNYLGGEKPFKCDQCHKSYTESSSLLKHTRTHTGVRPFNCDQCHKSFTQSAHLKSHMRTHTQEKPFKCDLCHKSFRSKGHLDKHTKIHTGEKPFICDQCPTRFRTREHLNKHTRTHTGEKPFICDQCHKTFSARSNLNTHMKTHIGEKPFRCDQCNKSFSENGHLQNHMITHDKPFKCVQCVKSYTESSDLRRHMRTHTGERPFKCDQCHKSFTERYILKRHMRTHQRESTEMGYLS